MFDMTQTETEAETLTKTRVTADMGAAPEDVFRQIEAFASNAQIDAAEGTARIETEEGSAIFSVTGKPARRLGALTLPVSALVITLDGFSDAAARTFLSAFKASTLRMGG